MDNDAPKAVMNVLRNQGIENFEPKRKTGRTTRLVCYALALMKEGGSVVFVVHDDAMIEYVADIAFRAAGDFLFRAEVRKDHRGPLIIRPQDCPAELRIQNARIGVGRDHTHILVDHMVRGEL